jgi:hypothetical protein
MARVSAKQVNQAGGEYAKLVQLYGDHDQSAQRAFSRYYDLIAEWEKQNPGKKWGAMKAKRNPVASSVKKRLARAAVVRAWKAHYTGNISTIQKTSDNVYKSMKRYSDLGATDAEISAAMDDALRETHSLRHSNPRRQRRRGKNPRSPASIDRRGKSLTLARSAFTQAVNAKDARMRQARISYAQGVNDALRTAGVFDMPQSRVYLDALRGLL